MAFGTVTDQWVVGVLDGQTDSNGLQYVVLVIT